MRMRVSGMVMPVILSVGALAAAGVTSTSAASDRADKPTVIKGFAGVNDTQLTPLDANGAAGPSSFVETINTYMAIYSRTGTQLGKAQFGAITGHPQNNLSDPMVLWDPATQRFYYNIWDTALQTQEWGFSKTSAPKNPTTDFCNYTAVFGYVAPQLTDYPKLGQTANFLTIGVNVYDTPTAQHSSHSDLLWITKPQGSAPVTVCPAPTSFASGKFSNLKNVDGSSAWTPMPAIQTDPSPVGYITAMKQIECPDICGTGNYLTEFSIAPTPGNPSVPTLSAPHAITVASYAPPAKAPEKGSTNKLDTLDGRLTHSVSGVDPRINATAVWVAHSVLGGAGSEVRWYEINTSGAYSVAQTGAVNDPKLFVFDAGITNDRTVTPSRAAHGSTMVLSVTTSSTTTFPTSAMVSKVGGAAQSAIVPVKASTKPENDFSCNPGPCRWGDYGGATPDPAASLTSPNGTVWLTNEWSTGVMQSWIWEANP